MPDDDPYLGVDRAEAVGEDGGFGFADGICRGVDLAVDIADAEVIEVDEREFSDSRACQGFGDPGTYPAQTNDHGMAGGEFVECGLAVEACDAGETVEVVVSHGDLLADKWIEQKRRMR